MFIMNEIKNCPCDLKRAFSECCGPFLKREKAPTTAVQLMRARYTAYTLCDMDYIESTTHPRSRKDFDKKEAQRWAQESKWQGLQVLSTEGGEATDKMGKVEFIATYSQKDQGVDHHEVATFLKSEAGSWFFEDGEHHTHKAGEGHSHKIEKPKTVKHEVQPPGRNDPCSCGSGKKYKKCCGAA
jgi:SEC-C motif domain protein